MEQNRRERDFPWQIICNLWIGIDPAPIRCVIVKCDQLIKDGELEAGVPQGFIETGAELKPTGFLFLEPQAAASCSVGRRGSLVTIARVFP